MKTFTPPKPRTIADDLEEIATLGGQEACFNAGDNNLILSVLCQEESDVGSCSDSFFQLN